MIYKKVATASALRDAKKSELMIISRSDAISAGLSKYYTGDSCKHGHIDERYTVNGSCLSCDLLYIKKRYHENPKYNTYLKKMSSAQKKRLKESKK